MRRLKDTVPKNPLKDVQNIEFPAAALQDPRMQRWQLIAVILSTFMICAGGTCSEEPPAECLAFVSCFAAEGNPYAEAGLESPYLPAGQSKMDSDDVDRELIEAYGADGNCWLLSPEGRVWTSCHLACAQEIKDHCEPSNEAGSAGQMCLSGTGDAKKFGRDGDPDELMIECDDISETVEMLKQQLPPEEQADSSD